MTRLDDAFDAIRRENFLPEEHVNNASIDAPIPIGYGQTNSQPSTVYVMLDWLDPQPGEKILDVGSGSGWTTALLATLVGPTGKVYAVEKVEELVSFGQDNCLHSGIKNASFFQAGETFGLNRHAPYSKILVSAAAPKLPPELIQQLKIGGRLVIPVRNSIHVIDKTSATEYVDESHPGFAFVPLI